eukprot:117948_1
MHSRRCCHFIFTFITLSSTYLCNAQSSHYILVESNLSWVDAENYCVNLFETHLASIHSTDDMNNAKTICNVNHCWIGLYSFWNRWEWTDKTDTDYGFINSNPTQNKYPWANTQPSLKENEYCVQINLHSWNDTYCSHSYYALCNSQSTISPTTLLSTSKTIYILECSSFPDWIFYLVLGAIIILVCAAYMVFVHFKNRELRNENINNFTEECEYEEDKVTETMLNGIRR